jgi:hypothetical protein
VRFELEGGSAELVETDGDHVVVEATRSAPPGATLSATLDGVAYSIKVRGAKRTGDVFRIEGRWVNLSRAQRERVVGPRHPNRP